jgi:phosphoesterase RecJ-like protein
MMDVSLMDEEIATCFLAGMMEKTKSFRLPGVTPHTLQKASALLTHGAKRDKIVDILYRTRNIPELRLWGRALARLKYDETHSLVWSALSQQDFLHAGAKEGDLEEVVEELIRNSPAAKNVLLLYENGERNIVAVFHTTPPNDARKLLAPFSPIGDAREGTCILFHSTIVEAERRLLAQIKTG